MIRLFQQLPLSRKILLGIVPLFLIFVSISVTIHNHFQEQEMMDQAQESARTYVEIIRESLVTMMINNYKVDQSFMDRVYVLEQFDSLHVLVNDLHFNEDLLTEERAQRAETRQRTLRPHDSVEVQVLKNGEPVFLRDGNTFRAVVPFTATKTCQKCHDVAAGYALGAVDLHISLSRISEAAAGNWRRSLYIFVAFSLLAIAVATYMFRTYVSRPISKLVEAAESISRGDLEKPVPSLSLAPVPGSGRAEDDEMQFLALRFDEMRRSLREKIGQLDQVNRSLSERNREIEEALRRLHRAQEELVRSERLAVTGRMTAQLSHEINNPIHNIRSLLESTVRKIDADSPARELVAVALEEVQRLAKLTRQMLDFYRGSVVEIERVPVDIRTLLTDLVRSNEQTLAASNVRIVLELPPAVPPILGSVDKLKQVFLNLILNARDAMPEGGAIRIDVLVSGGFIITRVADTGAGIQPEHLDRIFDAFFTTKREVSGVGLGLAVSYGIVRQHGGTIHVESVPGRGAVFTVRVPITGDHHGE
jgi:signal transduction histidine kinase